MTIKNRTDGSANVHTETVTTHVVEVALSEILERLGVGFADTVVLSIHTPSGRAKRVTLAPSFLIAPHHVPDYEYRA